MGNNNKNTQRPKIKTQNNSTMKKALEKAGAITKRQRISSKRYVKTFTNFDEGAEAICQNKDIEYFLKGVPVDIDSALSVIVDLAFEFRPIIAEKKDLLWEFQISANKVYVKTNKYVSFGWNVKSVRTENGYNTEYIFNVVLYGDNNSEFESYLLDTGWTEDVKEKPAK